MTSAQIGLFSLVPVAYLAGAIPFGLLVGLSKGVDPRKAGSGNIGATNVGRLLGGKFFAIVFTLDLLKGLLPTLAGGAILHWYGPAMPTASDYLLWLLVAFATILGHMYSIFIGFQGGKGVATSLGVILGVYPYYTLAGAVVVVAFSVVFLLTRYVSLASMVSAVAFVLGYLVLGLILHWDVFGSQWPLLAFAVLVAGLIIVKHRGNIARLRAGTEHRIGGKKLQPAAS